MISKTALSEFNTAKKYKNTMSITNIDDFEYTK